MSLNIFGLNLFQSKISASTLLYQELFLLIQAVIFPQKLLHCIFLIKTELSSGTPSDSEHYCALRVFQMFEG